jgi:hypothetical protein
MVRGDAVDESPLIFPRLPRKQEQHMSFLDSNRTGRLRSRRLPVDDAYTAWFNANSRCDYALRTWFSANQDSRREAYRSYVFELELEEAAAAELAQCAVHTARKEAHTSTRDAGWGVPVSSGSWLPDARTLPDTTPSFWG